MFDNGTEYSRLVSSIRAQCSRNENPEPIEPTPVRAQAQALNIERIKCNYGSRKISLTCQSVKPVPSNKVDKQLLDPSKKASGRLKSPLPSPIPSPMSSPLPSPSRSRFHVSRVSENSNKLTSSAGSSPSPSSSSSSPTFFPSKSSRFRVTPVPICAPIETPKQQKDQIITKTSTPLQYPLPHPQIPAKVSVPVQVDLPKKETIVMTEQIITISPAAIIPNIVQLPVVPPTPPQSVPESSLLNVSNSSLLSHSLDSPDPDYEVKKYMDMDSCSTFSSSMDSIDQPVDFHASINSADSLDILELVQTVQQPKVEEDVEVESKEVLSNENTLISNSSSSSNEGHTLTPTDLSPKDPQKRIRKTSWIHSIGGKQQGPEEKPPTTSYPATLDKLINLFHHPSTFFTKTSPESTMSSSPNSGSTSGAGQNKPKNNKDTGPVTRESPIAGLLHWAANTLSHNKKEEPHVMKQSASVPNHATTILQNISPENSINKSTNSQMIIESLPKSVKKELKENISPENTISCEKVVGLVMEPTASKVLFQVGDMDDDPQTAAISMADEQDDEDRENEKREVLVQIDGSLTHKTLGELAIDSMSILKHQDSLFDTSSGTRTIND